MWAKNILIYRRGGESLSDLEAQLARRKPVKPGTLEWFTQGWVPPAPFREEVAPAFGGFRIVKLQREDKVLPAPVIKAALKAKVADIARREGRKVGRKEQKQLKAEVTDELLAKAMTKESFTTAWLDERYVFVDSSSANKGETLLSALREALPPFPVALLRTNRSVGAAMTNWLAAAEAPGDFTLDADCTLEDPEKGGAKVTIRRADLTAEEVRKHIESGLQATSVALTWRDRISFVLTDKFQLKRIKFLEVVKEDLKDIGDDADAVFEATFRAMSGELAALVADLVSELGGFEAQETGDE